MAMVGAAAPAEPTAEVQELCDGFREAAQTAAQASGWNGVFAEFTAVSVLSQVVAGTNFFVKVKTGGDFAHLRIFQPLPHTGAPAELVAVRPGLKEEDELAYFEGS